MKALKTAYSYIRWSTVSQGETGRDSHTRQLNSAKQWIQEHGKGEYVLSDEKFIDPGKSASKGKHLAVDEFGRAKGELRRFIQNVEEGQIKAGSILLIDDFSRFSRLQPFQSLTLFQNVLNSGIGLVFTRSFEKRVITVELINKEPWLLHSIVMWLIAAYQEIEERSQKVKLAKQSLLKNIRSGIIQRNNLPKYFTFIPDSGSKSFGKYVHNEGTKIVKEIVKMFLDGKSLYAIAGHYNGLRIKTFKGAQWSGNGVSHVLRRNRLLVGEYKGLKNFVPPIVDEDTYNKIQNLLEQNKFHGQGKKGKISNLFRGLCFCADPNCGHTMSVCHNYNPKDRNTIYRYYRCAYVGQKNTICQNRHYFNAQDLEEEFFLNFIMKNPAQLLTENDNREVRELDKQITETQKRLNEVSAQVAKFILVSKTMNTSVDEMAVELTKMQKERDGLKSQLDNLNFQRSKIQGATHNFADLRKLVFHMEESEPVLVEDENNPDVLVDVGWDSKPMNDAILSIRESLKHEYVREGIRVMLPSLIGKITIDSNRGQFFVYNRMGKLVYESFEYENQRNTSETWKQKVREGVKKYWEKKRKMKKP